MKGIGKEYSPVKTAEMNDNRPRVAVMMSTYNGANYLVEQIESVLGQEGVRVEVVVRDDGSTDETLSILDGYSRQSNLMYYSGSNLGPALSFMDLVSRVPDADYYSFCDQDDVWLVDKLQSSVAVLARSEDGRPALAYSSLLLVDSQLKKIGVTSVPETVTLASALIANPVAGCTMVFNHELVAVLRNYANSSLTMHDAWVLRVCLAVGGLALCNPDSQILYRQHAANVVGGRQGVAARWARRFRTWWQAARIRELDAKSLLIGYSHLMTPEHRVLVGRLAYYRNSVRGRFSLLSSWSLWPERTEHRILFALGVLTGRL